MEKKLQSEVRAVLLAFAVQLSPHMCSLGFPHGVACCNMPDCAFARAWPRLRVQAKSARISETDKERAERQRKDADTELGRLREQCAKLEDTNKQLDVKFKEATANLDTAHKEMTRLKAENAALTKKSKDGTSTTSMRRLAESPLFWHRLVVRHCVF